MGHRIEITRTDGERIVLHEEPNGGWEPLHQLFLGLYRQCVLRSGADAEGRIVTLSGCEFAEVRLLEGDEDITAEVVQVLAECRA
jgi:hypothetical protein